MSNIINPNELLNPILVEQRFSQIQQSEFTAVQEFQIKKTARDYKQCAVMMYDNLNHQLQTESLAHNWSNVMRLTQQIQSVNDAIAIADKYDSAVKSRFDNLPTRKERLTDEERRTIFHHYHGDANTTQDMLAQDFRRSQSTIQGIVTSDPSKFTKN